MKSHGENRAGSSPAGVELVFLNFNIFLSFEIYIFFNKNILSILYLFIKSKNISFDSIKNNLNFNPKKSIIINPIFGLYLLFLKLKLSFILFNI